jgi:response regulator RpfG family c-di-GMP phosphodiesterase
MSRFNFGNVFIIDDDIVVRILVMKILKNIGYEGKIHQFENGETALNEIIEPTFEATNDGFNLVLLDINMPNMDGWGFLDAFTALSDLKKKGHFVTMITSSIDQADKEKAFSYSDVKDFIQKPVSVQLLKEFLMSHQLVEE